MAMCSLIDAHILVMIGPGLGDGTEERRVGETEPIKSADSM